jgi:hypothetical protein
VLNLCKQENSFVGQFVRVLHFFMAKKQPFYNKLSHNQQAGQNN